MVIYKRYSTLTLAACLVSACSGAENTSNENSARKVIRTSEAATKAPTVQVTPAKAKAEKTPFERGAALYKRCRACHTYEDGGRNKVGPNLWNIWGSKAASREGFAYSKALIASGITWDDETLDAYIRKPREFVKGTRMNFIGLKKDEDRAALLLYLKAETSPK